MSKIKICGMTRFEDAQLAASLGAWAIGFIFYEKSPRYITPSKAADIIKKIAPSTKKIGVFVNQSTSSINEIINQCNLDMIQLHGDESLEFCKSFNVPVIKAFRISKQPDMNVIDSYLEICEAVLFDTYDKHQFGGTGETFDWKGLSSLNTDKLIVAGGISNTNVSELVSVYKPNYIDCNSGIEVSPGKKDHKLMKLLFETVNSII